MYIHEQAVLHKELRMVKDVFLYLAFINCIKWCAFVQVPAPGNADKIPNRAGALLTCIKLHLSSTVPAKTAIRYSYLVVTGNEFHNNH